MLGRPSIGLVFPGQGTQHVGMGADLARAFPEAAEVFSAADEALGEPLTRLCFEGPEDTLQQTTNAQPAILACSIAFWRVVRARGDIHPVVAAGHSLGEYSALVAAEALDFRQAIRLVRDRARCMEAASSGNGGAGMLAILGLDRDAAEAVCRQAAEATGAGAMVANYNCPGQVVVGGYDAALAEVQRLAQGYGARRALRLAVSVASHTPLQQAAADAFAPIVRAVPVFPPIFPIVGNALIRPLTDPDDLRQEMVMQLVRPVDWPRTVALLREAGAEQLWEIGPRSVLAGLSKRIEGSPPVLTITEAADIEKLPTSLEAN